MGQLYHKSVAANSIEFVVYQETAHFVQQNNTRIGCGKCKTTVALKLVLNTTFKRNSNL